jgi:hypothetical protein
MFIATIIREPSGKIGLFGWLLWFMNHFSLVDITTHIGGT